MLVATGLLAHAGRPPPLRRRLVDDPIVLIGAALIEVGALVQLVVGLTNAAAIADGAERATFIAYLFTVLVVLPVTVVIAIKEKTQWAMAVVLGGAVVVAILVARLQQIWSLHALTPEPTHRPRPGRVLVAVYGLLALAATGRSILQISEYFERAPVSYVLSALAAVIYIVATVGLARGDRGLGARRHGGLVVELIGVLVVGAISYAVPSPSRTRPSGRTSVGLRLRAAAAARSSGCWWIRRTSRRPTAPASVARPPNRSPELASIGWRP